MLKEKRRMAGWHNNNSTTGYAFVNEKFIEFSRLKSMVNMNISHYVNNEYGNADN